MRKLRLMMQVSLDGFAGDTTGNSDWMVWNWGSEWTWDQELRAFHTSLITSSDCLLLSRKMAEEGFHAHWEKVIEDRHSPQYSFAKHLVDIPKLVFSKTLTQAPWKNTELVSDEYVKVITELKQTTGKALTMSGAEGQSLSTGEAALLIFGGPTFAASLLRANLIDELYLFVNPVALGEGMALFREVQGRTKLELIRCKAFACDVVVLHYKPKVQQVEWTASIVTAAFENK